VRGISGNVRRRLRSVGSKKTGSTEAEPGRMRSMNR
jgi:hypothetical protein